jgi:hypothetical protein
MDSAPKHASHQERKFGTEPSNGSDPVKAEEKTNRPEPPPLSTTEFPATRSPVHPGAPSEPPVTATPLWLARIWVVIRVAFFIELGMVLVVLPWTRVWTENHLLLAQPAVRTLLQNYFVRGLVSGLGFIDIGFGIWEAVRYKEPRRNQGPS